MESKMVPFEKYSLTLKHEIIDENGKAYTLNEPIVVTGMISLFERKEAICPVNVMIHNLCDRMKHEAMQKYGEI